MNAQRRGSLWPVLIVAIGIIWLLMVMGMVPESTGDLLTRSWPAVLVLFGLDLLAGRSKVRVGKRSVPLRALAVMVTVVLLGIVIWQAYVKQADVVRADSIVTFTEQIGGEVVSLRIEVDLKRTAVTIESASESTRMLDAVFSGSQESDVSMAWRVDAGIGSLRIDELYKNAIPKLEDYGRGTLVLQVPAGVPVELIRLDAAEGTVTGQIDSLLIQRIEVSIDAGDIALQLPGQDAVTGVLRTDYGNILITVPDDVPLRIRLAEGSANPEYDYDEMRYYLLAGGTLERRNAEFIQAEFVVDVNGSSSVRVEDVAALQ